MTQLAPVNFVPHQPFEAKALVWSHLGYVPSKDAVAYHRSMAHVRVVYGGWRAGKSTTWVMDTVGVAVVPVLRQRPDGYAGLIWIIGPDFAQAHAEFQFLCEAWRKLGVLDEKSVSMPREGRWQMRSMSGWVVETQSSRYIETLGGVTVDILCVAEAGQHDEAILEWAIGRTAESYGPITLEGTLEEASPWYAALRSKYPIYPNAAEVQTFSLPTWSNPIYHSNPNPAQRGEHDPRLRQARAVVGERIWRLRFGGVPEPPREQVFWEFRTTPSVVIDDTGINLSTGPVVHVSELAEYDGNHAIVLAVDPGEVYTVLACYWNKEVHILRGSDVAITVPVLHVFDEISIQHGMFSQVRERVLDWKQHLELKLSVHDRATTQHHNNASQLELWQQPVDDGGLGIDVVYSHQPLGIRDGVELFHRWLIYPPTGQPLIRVHPRCSAIIEEIPKERYARPRTQGRAQDVPIDRSNHARKALCYLINYVHGLRLPMDEEAMAKAFKHIKGWSRSSL